MNAKESLGVAEFPTSPLGMNQTELHDFDSDLLFLKYSVAQTVNLLAQSANNNKGMDKTVNEDYIKQLKDSEKTLRAHIDKMEYMKEDIHEEADIHASEEEEEERQEESKRARASKKVGRSRNQFFTFENVSAAKVKHRPLKN